MVHWRFGARWFGFCRIPLWKGLLLEGTLRIPNHQLIISWKYIYIYNIYTKWYWWNQYCPITVKLWESCSRDFWNHWQCMSGNFQTWILWTVWSRLPAIHRKKMWVISLSFPLVWMVWWQPRVGRGLRLVHGNSGGDDGDGSYVIMDNIISWRITMMGHHGSCHIMASVKCCES